MATSDLLLRIAATDATFAKTADGRAVAGKCIHCNSALLIPFDRAEKSGATVEHIVPRTHGGTDELTNLAIACRRCNVGKGTRLDHRRWGDAKLQEVIATLSRRRTQRWRDPPAEWASTIKSKGKG